MPIKLKCSCGHVLSVPDAAAGKTGKCPKCQQQIRVPQKRAAVAKPQVAPAAVPGNAALESLFDDAGLEKKTGPVCGGCGTDIKPGTIVCTACGFNMQTGERLVGANIAGAGKEFDNQYLQEAADNMVRDKEMDTRRAKAQLPWWLIMSVLMGLVFLTLSGIGIADRFAGVQSDPGTFMGKMQALPILVNLGGTVFFTGAAITFFAHLDICYFAFRYRGAGQGAACFFAPIFYSLVFAIMNFRDNAAPVKAIMIALVLIGIGSAMIIRGGGFGLLFGVF